MYFCCLEALQNVAKHAPDARVTIRLATAATARSSSPSPTTAPASTRRPPPAARACTNMADRLGAVGGTLRIRSTPGAGTEVGGRVPVGDRRTRLAAPARVG